MNVGIRPGLTYFFTPGFSAYLNFGLLQYTLGGIGSGSGVSNDINLSANANTFSIGVQYFIRKTKDKKEQGDLKE